MDEPLIATMKLPNQPRRSVFHPASVGRGAAGFLRGAGPHERRREANRRSLSVRFDRERLPVRVGGISRHGRADPARGRA